MRKFQIARSLNRRRLNIDTTRKGRTDVQINHDPMIFAVWQYVVYRREAYPDNELLCYMKNQNMIFIYAILWSVVVWLLDV